MGGAYCLLMKEELASHDLENLAAIKEKGISIIMGLAMSAIM